MNQIEGKKEEKVRIQTIKDLIQESISKHPEENSLSFFDEKPITYSELGKKITELSALLKENGIRKGDKVAILGENSPNWGISYLSIVTMGAIAVPILPDFPSEDLEHILNHSESKLLFATKKQVEKISYENCKFIKSIITLDDFSMEDTDFHTIPFSEFLNDTLEKVTNLLYDLVEKTGFISTELNEDDLAVVIYTSGTTGLSKGVMLTHKNLISNVDAMNEIIPFSEKDKFLSVLPLSHVLESTIGFLLPLSNASSIYYLGKAPTPTLMKRSCELVKPTAIPLVPLIIEKIYKKKVKTLLEKNFIIKGITKTPFVKKLIYKKAAKAILEFFGGNIKLLAFGGAPLNSEVEDFLLKGGFPYVIGYGLTETAPLLTGESLSEVRRGSCGYPIKDVEIKIIDPDPKTGIGEIFAKGPNVMKGYYKNKNLTDEVLSADGWFKTGDRGYLDKDNYLYIKGRSKSMFLGANGENIFPETIEIKLNSMLLVQESLVIENHGDIEALIYLNPDVMESKLEGKSEKEQEKSIAIILEQIRTEVNPRISTFSRIKRCYLQREPFVKTATQKIKRFLYYHPDTK
jgi:long-chain acyl-CoA synthetase